jgi:outer membrane protein assembly factor BamD (BamD/ComL family)
MFSQMQQFQQDFKQLGQDLKTGNLSQAQSDFVTLENDATQGSSMSTSSSQSDSPMAQAFNQLAQDLQSENLSAAQSDFSTIQQDFQNQASQTHHHHHHPSSGSQESQVSQLFSQLGQDLQSGNLSNAQTDFSSLQQLLQSNTSTSSGATTGGLSINA